MTIHRVADRHADLHGRAFAGTRVITVEPNGVAQAITAAFRSLALENSHGKYIVTIDWPHDG